MRAKVLLPTATLPATPITYGARGRHRPEERRRHPGEVLRCADAQVEQPGQRQVDRRDLVEVDLVVDAAQLLEVLLAQRQRRRGAQGRPLVAPDRQVPALRA